jgi:hypothetical protein
MVFTVISCAVLLFGPLDRRGGQGLRIAGGVACVIVLQGFYLAAVSMAQQNDTGLVLMYFLVFAPLLAAAVLFSGKSHMLVARFKMLRRVRP